MKTLLVTLFLIFALAASAQVSLSDAKLPPLVLAGASFNQFQGWNALLSGVIPESNSVGMYASLTADISAVRYTNASGKSGYLLSPNFRAGQHKTLWRSGRNMLLLGGDLGFALTQPNQPVTATPTAASVTIGLAGSFTATYVRQINAHFAASLPVRMLWLSNVGPNGAGAWNPVVEAAFVWIP